MKTLILFIAVLSLMSIATVTADTWCCTDGCFSGTTESDIRALCEGNVVSGSCDAAAACQTPGCCCDIGEHITESACVAAAGAFYPDVSESECSDFCGDISSPGDSCGTVEANIRNTLGTPDLTIGWTVCNDIESVEIKKQGGTTVASFDGPGPGTWTDDSTEWETTYRYQVIVTTNDAYTFELLRYTGDQECEGATAPRSCDGNAVQICSLNNIDQGRQECSGSCDTINGVGQCEGVPDICQLSYTYLSVAHPDMCQVQGSSEGVSCYYDRSSTGIDGCYDCNSATHCYDFKTKYACDQAQTVCPLFEEGCSWESFGSVGLGEGFCRPKKIEDANMCSFLFKPEGDRQTDLYSPLLTPTQHDSSAAWFSIADYQCTAVGASCGSAFSESSCESIVPSADYSCEWRESYCAKHSFSNEYFPYEQVTDYLCDDDPSSVCERITTRPSISLTHEVDFDARTISFIPIVRDSEGRLVTSLSGYRFSTCTGSCATSFDFTDTTQPTDGRFTFPFSYFGITETLGNTVTFAATVRDPGYNVAQPATRTVTIDPNLPNPTLTIRPIAKDPEDPSMGDHNDRIEITANWNRGSNPRVTIDGLSPIPLSGQGTIIHEWNNPALEYEEEYTARLTVDLGSQPHPSDPVEFTLSKPAFYITIEEPGSFIPENGTFTITVVPSEPADECAYAITTRSTPPSAIDIPLERSGTDWTQTVTRAGDGWLHVHCTQGPYEDTQKKQLIYAPQPPHIIRINVTPGEKLMFPSVNGDFIATFNVYTDVRAVCRFTDDDWTTTPSTETVLERSFTQSGQVTIICKNTVESESKTIDITVDPAATWFGFLKPSGTFRAALIPYHIGTGGSGLYAVCSIPEIEKSGLTGQDIIGTFDPDDFDWYEGDGTYPLSARCIGYPNEDLTGETTVPETITTSFTIDNTKPALAARINGVTQRIEITEPPIPTNTYVRFSYSDASPIRTLSYTISSTNDSKTWTTIKNATLSNLGTSGSRSVQFDFPLKDQTEYRVSARITDAAGNYNETTSNRLTITLPDPCDTGEICGGACGATCDIGDQCTNSSDCAGGEQVICTDAGFCDYEHCYNNKPDPERGETGVDCGGSCGACTITLVEPTFGVSATKETRVVVNTTQTMLCTYSDGGGQNYSMGSTPSKTHTISRVDVTNVPLINVSCKNDQTNEWNTFALTYDPREPQITFQANPDIEGRTSETSDGFVYATTFTAKSTNDVAIICRVSEKNEAYDEMTDYLGSDYQTDQNEKSYRNVQNEIFGFKDTGTYRLYVDCLAKNGLTSGATHATFTADPNAKPTPRIVSPIADRVYSNDSLTAVVDARSIQAQACFDRLESFDMQKMTLAQGTVYERDLNLIEGENLRYTGMCEYVVSSLSQNGSASLRFSVDRTPPEIESVTIRDPQTQNTTTLTAKNGVEIIVLARDETTYISRYEYEIRVNGELVSEGLRMRSKFYDNTLNLSSGDRVRATVTVTDAVGNKASEQSNQLTHTPVPIPDVCEEEGICGGECPPCPDEGDSCDVTTDCESGLYCSEDVCVDEETICTNGKFDPDYEAARDCGGICEPCDEGAECTTSADCGKNQYCAPDRTCTIDYLELCSNEEHDEKHEAGVDCGGVCDELFGLSCAIGCNTNADCAGTSICKGGTCTAEYTPPTNLWCTKDVFNNTLEDGTFCGRGCGELCPEGVGCRLSTDCEKGLECGDEGVCVEKQTETTGCFFPTDPNPPACGGDDCEPCGLQRMCKRDADCRSGSCEGGFCAKGDDDTTDTNDTIQVTQRGGLDEQCYPDQECDPGLRCNDENVCVKAPSVWRWIIFVLLFVLLGVAGYIAYRYYYLPNQKPDYQEGQLIGSETANAAFDEHGSAESSVNPPAAPPVMSEKQQHVSELIREKREQKKQEEREELLSAFDESALDTEPTRPQDVAKTKLPKETVDEKPVVATRKKSHDSFKEILDEAKDQIE